MLWMKGTISIIWIGTEMVNSPPASGVSHRKQPYHRAIRAFEYTPTARYYLTDNGRYKKHGNSDAAVIRKDRGGRKGNYFCIL